MQKQVTTKITWDMNTMRVVDGKPFMKVLEHTSRTHSGAWMLCKGDNTLKVGEQGQGDFNGVLRAAFQSQYKDQKAILDYLNPIMKGMIDHPTGVAPQALTAMRTSASDTIAAQGANARAAVAANEAARGGGTGLPSGVEGQIDAGMAVAQAQQQASAQSQITQYDEDVRQKNFWNAVSGLSGNAQMMNPQSYAGEANSGSNTLAGLGDAYNRSRQSGLLNAAVGGIASVAGGWATGGFKMPGGKPA